MVTAVTEGITVSVITNYEGFAQQNLRHVFAYRVHIENNSKDTVQLLRRHWFIYDSNGEIREVEGEGVIGEQPTLSPAQYHQYSSWCPLATEIGLMTGTFLMQRKSDGSTFKVQVPEFKMITPYRLN